MKKVLYSLLFLCSILGLWSCDESSEDTSKITYFVTFEIKGDAIMQVPVGSTFTDLGVVAMEGEDDVTASVVVKSNVDTNKIGVYSISYFATNVDGFDSSTERTVIVYDPSVTTDVSGAYTVDSSVSYRDMGGAKAPFKGDYNVTVKQVAPGVFSVSDFIGGWYDQGAAYGSTYAMTGYFKLNPDNTIEPLSSFLQGWGDSMDGMTGGKYDQEIGQISWSVDYAGQMTFYVVMNK